MAKPMRTTVNAPQPADCVTGRATPSSRSRPGSAVSHQFLPSRQQSATEDWRRHQQQQQERASDKRAATTAKNSATYGYVPFKTAPLPIYGFRVNSRNNNNNNTANHNTTDNNKKLNNKETVSVKSGNLKPNNGNNNIDNNSVNRPPYPTAATYAPLIRVDSAISGMSALGGELPPLTAADRGALGMCRSASRYQSYTTLPHPEPYDLGVPTSIYCRPPSAVYGNPPQPIYGIYGAPAEQPPSVYCSAPIESFVTDAPPAATVADEIGRAGLKPIINWNILILSSYLQIVLATALIGAGAIRLIFQIDSAVKSYDLAHGVTALLAAVAGLLAVRRRRGYTLVFVAFALSALNALFFVACAFQGDLFLSFPLLFGSGASRPPASAAAAGTSPLIVDAFEMEMAVTVLSVLKFITALVSTFYGCKALGALTYHVEVTRLSIYYGSGADGPTESVPPYPRPAMFPIPFAANSAKRPL